MQTVIPNGQDPSKALDKMMAHFTCLEQMKWQIPKKIQGMMLLSKAPASMEAIIQLISTKSDPDDSDVDPEKIAAAMHMSWETHQRQGTGRGSNQQQAQKLSAVKPADGNPPSFDQQQERGDGGFRGRGRGGKRRGNRGGQNKKNAQQQLQQAVVQDQSQPGPSQGPPPQIPPQTQGQ
jgi:hypothetical protein